MFRLEYEWDQLLLRHYYSTQTNQKILCTSTYTYYAYKKCTKLPLDCSKQFSLTECGSGKLFGKQAYNEWNEGDKNEGKKWKVDSDAYLCTYHIFHSELKNRSVRIWTPQFKLKENHYLFYDSFCDSTQLYTKRD